RRMRRQAYERLEIGVEIVVRSLFFFSSRRRHTRSKRDWSSDVCSSDLCRAQTQNVRHDTPVVQAEDPAGASQPRLNLVCNQQHRSEERRVGKEWRSRCLPEPGKEKTQ